MALKCSAVFLLFISQLLVSCNSIPQKCKSGISDLTDKEEDNTLWQCQKEKGLDDELITSKLDSKQVKEIRLLYLLYQYLQYDVIN